jgi:hypothetical protein
MLTNRCDQPAAAVGAGGRHHAGVYPVRRS